MGRCPLGWIAFRVSPVAVDRVQLLPSELLLLVARGSRRLRRLAISTRINKRGKHGASTRRSQNETCPGQQPRLQRTGTIRGSHRAKKMFFCFRSYLLLTP